MGDTSRIEALELTVNRLTHELTERDKIIARMIKGSAAQCQRLNDALELIERLASAVERGFHPFRLAKQPLDVVDLAEAVYRKAQEMRGNALWRLPQDVQWPSDLEAERQAAEQSRASRSADVAQ